MLREEKKEITFAPSLTPVALVIPSRPTHTAQNVPKDRPRNSQQEVRVFQGNPFKPPIIFAKPSFCHTHNIPTETKTI